MQDHPLIKLCRDTTKVYQVEFKPSFLLPRYWPAWFGLGLLWLIHWLPGRCRHWLSVPLGYLSYRFSGKRRRIAQINLGMCFPALSDSEKDKIIRQHFYVKMRAALDYSLLWWASAKRINSYLRIVGEDNYRQLFERGTPVIFLTPHSLALDFGATALTTRYPGVGMFKPARNPLANWLLQRGRVRFNAVLYPRADGFRHMIKAVRKGPFCYYLPDEDFGGSESVFAPFFATQASTLTTLGRLAKLSHAVVVPIYSYLDRNSGRYVLHIGQAMENYPGASREQDAIRMNQEIERLIELEPSQYMWGMKLFNTRPPGEKNPYD